MTQFSDLKLDPKVLQAITEAGYTTPTPIQAGAIPPALEGRDVLGIAQTGTGKTASFTLPMITLLGRGRTRARMPRSLVLCPTRELAAQVAENFDIYAKHTRLTKALLIGGVSMKDQERLIDRGVDVLIATPGRLLDHFERGNLLLQGVQIMVVDEADRMLDMGFIPDIERIFQLTPFTRQTLFFSATMAPEIERITDTFLHAPERIEVARQATTSETITQRLIEITPTRKDQSAKQKRELLRALINAEGEGLKNAIIFCNRKTEVDIVAKSLKAHGFDAAPIHGDLEQAQRMRTLDGFRDGTLRFLVASDVAARGLDIPAVSHVFNFDLPTHAEDYVHRIGRTGRAGRQGTAISLAIPSDEKYLAAIENLVKSSLPRAALPEGFAISDAAREAPRAPREDRGGRSGRKPAGRGRGPRGKDELIERSAGTQPIEAPSIPVERAPVAEAEPRAAARQSDKQVERRNERRDESREDRRDARRDEPRHDRRDEQRRDRDDRRGGRDGQRDERKGGIVGLGDHVPDFMNRSFRTSPAPDTTEDAAPQKPAAEAASAEREHKRDEKRGRSRRGRGRNRGEDRTASTDPASLEATVPEAVIPDALAAPEAGLPDSALSLETVAMPEATPEPVSDPVLDDAPPSVEVVLDPDPQTVAPVPVEVATPAKRTRTRKPKAASITAAPEVADAVPADEVAPVKPKRTRKPKAAPAEVAAVADAGTAKPKRTRKPRAKVQAAADVTAAGDMSEAPTTAERDA